jgi:hypothetical protein
MNVYIVGQPIVLSDLITDPVTDVPVVDGTTTCTVYQPDGTSATPSVIFPGDEDPDAYDAQFTPTMAGVHEAVFRASNTGAGAGIRRFIVRAVP